ncbi:sensor histidine kinase [Arthrobacter sp. H35-D1]|uniref:sensor histidine kinase n=1 Tax=Arthrobacter sp. H35-D1 TaxID=3046202 RepID=UPI0024B966C7|nr:sensor histidine kinase [Arthrobacter sp. H35-D1]MDJ0312102.1 sensor histidine kinase [Arthrobacter sp. H35-D1]
MRTQSQAGDGQRTATPPAESPSAERRAEEFAARRRGAVRTYFYNHPRIMDAVVVLSYLLVSSSSLVNAAWSVANLGVHFVLVLAIATVLMFRRDRPLAVLVIVSISELMNILLVPGSGNIGVGIWFALYSAAVRYRPIVSVPLAVASSLPLALFTFFFYQFPSEYVLSDGPTANQTKIISAIMMLLANIIAAGIGASVRSARQHDSELRQWAIRNAQLASVAERNRIAREMHDVVAHSLTVMVALSDGAAVVVKRDPAKAAEVLSQLSQTGRTALSDMRRVLGVLRAEGGTRRTPQPHESDMGALIEGFRQAGMSLTFAQSGPPMPQDPALALTVYRIVQESLTNVLRHGTAVSRVQVEIENDLDRDKLSVRINDDGHGSVNASMGSGNGIAGMRERAGIYAGTVDAGPAAQGGWRVVAVLHPGIGTS